MYAKMNLKRAVMRDNEDCNAMTDNYKRVVIFEDAGESLTISFFKGGKYADEMVCGTWQRDKHNFSCMNNKDENGCGRKQRVTWSTCDSGVRLAAQWFLDQHNEHQRLWEKKERDERNARRKALREQTRKAHPQGLKGGGTSAGGLLFKLPAA